MSFRLAMRLAVLLALCACGEKASDVDLAHAAPGPEGARIARIAPEAARNVGIEVSEAGPSPIREVLPLYGVVQPNGERVRNVTARFPGIVRSVRASAGQSVTAREQLASVESNDSLQTYPVTAPIDGVVTT